MWESESNTDGNKKLFYILLLRVFEKHVDSFQYLSEKEEQRTAIQNMTLKLSCNQHNVSCLCRVSACYSVDSATLRVVVMT